MIKKTRMFILWAFLDMMIKNVQNWASGSKLCNFPSTRLKRALAICFPKQFVSCNKPWTITKIVQGSSL